VSGTRAWALVVGAWLAADRAHADDSAAQSPSYGATATAASAQESGSVSSEASAAARRAGSLGEPARALLDVPGAARAGFAGGELVVWGATPAETRVYVDGVEIPALFHPAGFRTTVHPALLSKVTLTPGAPSASYGRALGGVCELSTLSLKGSDPHGALRADAIDTSVEAQGGAGPVRALVAARYGYLDRVVGALAPDSSQGVLAIPAHLDGAARLEASPDARTRLKATYLFADDRTRVRGAPGPGDFETRRQRFQTAMLRYERRYDDAARVRITPFLTVRDASTDSEFSSVPLGLDERGYAGGARAEYTRTRGALGLRFGVDARVERTHVTRSGTLTLPAREGDIRLFGQPPLASLNADDYRVTTGDLAPHATVTVRLGPLSVEPGLRVETLFVSSSRSAPRFRGAPAVGHDDLWVFADPRIRVSYAARAWATLELRAGIYHQAPEARDLSAVFGSPTLRPARAFHAALGSMLSPGADVQVALWGFAKELDQLAVRTELDPIPLAESLTSTGRGRAVGGSLGVSREAAAGLFGSLAYTLSHSLRSDPDGSLRRFDQDQPHVLSLGCGWGFAHGSLSLRLRAASGNPRTRVVGTTLDGVTGQLEPLFGRHNGARNPAFFQLDLHGERSFTLGPATLALWLDVLNATNAVSVESVAYTQDFRARRDVRGIPLVAMVGARLGY
jgi:TonB-dependent Receptor Plug Domain